MCTSHQKAALQDKEKQLDPTSSRWRASRCTVWAQAGESSGERRAGSPVSSPSSHSPPSVTFSATSVTQPLCASVSSTMKCKAMIGLTL